MEVEVRVQLIMVELVEVIREMVGEMVVVEDQRMDLMLVVAVELVDTQVMVEMVEQE